MSPSKKKVRNDRIPTSLFFLFLGVLLMMSGVHTGLVVLMSSLGWAKIWQVLVPIVYWSAVAVAHGDFSVYVPPIHTSDRLDYLDLMIIDFNKMVEELGSIETLKTDFFSNVSHEIKTPLAVIQNNAELLRLTELTDEQRECADTVYHASARLADLITNILKLNKLEKQNSTPETRVYDVCAQLADCALGFESAWEDKDIDFEADLEDRALIAADSSLLELVWNNLLSNAIKFIEPGGMVTLTETSDEEFVRVSVADTGCGMSEETQKHIFEKFYQGDTSHATAGNGLGLALASRVVQLSGFTIRAESTLGKGSVFTVEMPRAKEEDNNERI